MCALRRRERAPAVGERRSQSSRRVRAARARSGTQRQGCAERACVMLTQRAARRRTSNAAARRSTSSTIGAEHAREGALLCSISQLARLDDKAGRRGRPRVYARDTGCCCSACRASICARTRDVRKLHDCPPRAQSVTAGPWARLTTNPARATWRAYPNPCACA